MTWEGNREDERQQEGRDGKHEGLRWNEKEEQYVRRKKMEKTDERMEEQKAKEMLR